MSPTAPLAAPQARLAAFFFAAFLFAGIQLPYWPLWLQARGFDAHQVGALLFGFALGRGVAAPLIGLAADRWGSRRGILLLCSVLMLPTMALHAIAGSFATQMALHVATGTLMAASVPLADNLALLAEQSHGADYARVRAWGSKAFIAAALGGGMLLSGRAPSIVLPLMLVTIIAMIWSAWRLPDLRPAPPPVETRAAPRSGAFAALAGNRRFVRLVLAVALIHASHGAYYAFGTLHWRALGLSEAVIGLLWTEGVIAEILIFYFGARLLARFGTVPLLLVSACAAAVRWPATAAATTLAPLLVLQLLHALSFGAGHLAAMRLLREAVPAAQSATAQTLHSSIVGSFATGGAMWLAGLLWDRLGANVFTLMTLPCVLGAWIAVGLRRS